jgi:protein-export membrane protein SecD
MRKNKIYITVLAIFVLAVLAAGLDYGLPQLPKVPFKLGLDLQGGTHLIYEADLSNIEKDDYSSSMQGLRDVIERRVNLFGVQEPVVQTQEAGGHYRLIVELAGVKDPNQAIKEIGKTPFLEFREPKENYEEIIEKNRRLVEAGKEAETEDPFQSTPLTGKYLEKAELGFDKTTYKPLILLRFNNEGADIFKELTKKNIGKPLAIYIDGIPISTPVVQEEISGGKAQITGQFTIEEAKKLARNLNAGALPVPINLISQQSVGPTLGAISLQKSLRAGIWGLLAVFAFMVLFYRLPGFLASIALVIYVALVLALFKLIPVTLTLAGIGGFILSIGMAIDANILIFSRMREELKEGRSFSMAVEEGFRRAWPSIRDGNFTTLIVALVLFGFGTSFVKGFAFTLTIGILMSMFSAIIITKNFLRCFVGTKLEKVKILWH